MDFMGRFGGLIVAISPVTAEFLEFARRDVELYSFRHRFSGSMSVSDFYLHDSVP